jgi:hypothetical protein
MGLSLIPLDEGDRFSAHKVRSVVEKAGRPLKTT